MVRSILLYRLQLSVAELREAVMDRADQGPAAVAERLLEAINAHDLDTMVACFADDYVNEWPAHPQRSFRGNQQVGRNWSQIFATVPDLRARLPRTAVDGDTVWTEWDISGTRSDGAAFLDRKSTRLNSSHLVISYAVF